MTESQRWELGGLIDEMAQTLARQGPGVGWGMKWPFWGSRDEGLILSCGSDQLLSFAALTVTQIHIPPTIPRGECHPALL